MWHIQALLYVKMVNRREGTHQQRRREKQDRAGHRHEHPSEFPAIEQRLAHAVMLAGPVVLRRNGKQRPGQAEHRQQEQLPHLKNWQGRVHLHQHLQ